MLSDNVPYQTPLNHYMLSDNVPTTSSVEESNLLHFSGQSRLNFDALSMHSLMEYCVT